MPRKTIIDHDAATVTVEHADGPSWTAPLASDKGFQAVSDAWLRAGWDAKYVYGFTWMGRPVIQLPEDLLRIQEWIYQIKPTVLIETGIAHGGSLIFYASVFKAMGRGRVIGVDIDIRAHNRAAIEAHDLFDAITMFEGGSTDPGIVEQVNDHVRDDDVVMVCLDSNHSFDHVLAELRAYAPLVTPGSYIIAADGIMRDLVGAPRSQIDWDKNNPVTAARAFLDENHDFDLVEPDFPFNEGVVSGRVTYWPAGVLQRRR